MSVGDDVLNFYYDSGAPVLLTCNGSTHYYIANLQGDVMSIVDGTGTVVAEYEYDPYGNIISATGELAEVNPIRYRGYVYDKETGLYYLQSRYYNARTGRFLNADALIDTDSMLGQNLFAYCENMPVICIDISGYRKVYVIYYDDEERGFEDQAKNSAYYAINIDDVTLIGVTTNQEFIDAWNSIGDDADCIHLFVHGGEGVLHFKEESLRFPDAKNDTSSLSFADLEPKSVNGTVYLWSCDGGKGDVGNNVAFMFADLTNTYVHACTGHVSYTKYFGKYYARKSFKDLGMWHRFFYSESYFNPDLRYAVKF